MPRIQRYLKSRAIKKKKKKKKQKLEFNILRINRKFIKQVYLKPKWKKVHQKT